MSSQKPDDFVNEEQAHSGEHDEDGTRINRRTWVTGAVGSAAAIGAAGSSHAMAAQDAATPDPTLTPEAEEVHPEDAEIYAPWTGEGVNGSALPPNIPPWMQYWGPLPSPYGERSRFEDHVLRVADSDTNPARGRTPLQDLHGTITPNSLFFERHHAGIPDIDPGEHRLMIHGMVDYPTIFTMEDIKRFPSTTVVHFLECAGNSRTEWSEETSSQDAQIGFGMLSQTEWTGVPVKTILNEVGASADATWMLAEGADAAGMDRSIPIEKALDDAILAYAMNGEALRPSAGYPLRLLLPGWEGNANIKWLRRLELGNAPWHTREETSKYTDLMPDGTARQFTFVMEAKSVITYPSGGQTLAEHGFHEISGLAWSGRGKITKVEVSVDGGETWEDAQLQEPVLPKALTRFRLPWQWEGQSARLQSRATDETGYVQPTLQQLLDVRGSKYSYHMNGIKAWTVGESGEVEGAWG